MRMTFFLMIVLMFMHGFELFELFFVQNGFDFFMRGFFGLAITIDAALCALPNTEFNLVHFGWP